MNFHVTLHMVEQRFQEHNLPYEIFTLQNGFQVLCTARGGRIMGPFDPETGESIWWISEALTDPQKFNEFLDTAQWNLGGDRLWIAPEMPLYIPDRTDFFDSYVVQPEIDPGNYSLERTERGIRMAQTVRAKTFEVPCDEKRFSVERQVWQAEDPLRALPQAKALTEHVQHCGLRQQISLTALDDDTNVYLEPWVLTQVNPAGKLLVPCIGPAEYVDYYEPLPESMRKISGSNLEIDVTGDVRYKLGFRSAQTMGRAGYLGKLSDGQSYLFLRFYGNNPSNTYCGDPFDRPGLYGCSMYLYNDNGGLGGFAEFENAGTTISGDTPLRTTADQITYHIYKGEESQLRNISQALLGIH